MAEITIKRVHPEQVVLDIGEGVGALILYTRESFNGLQIDVTPQGSTWPRTHTDVLERRINAQRVFAAVFPILPEGTYYIWKDLQTPVSEVTITGGQVTEADWRMLLLNPDPFSTDFNTTCTNSFSNLSNILPPRYQNNAALKPAAMAAAPLRYTPDGQVAWDLLWTDFCDLALAGGPPHRGTLLESVSPDEIAANPLAYQQVINELARGLQLVTGLTTIQHKQPGWIGLQCHNEEMALWLLRAIIVENISVHRSDTVLYLPAGPAFRLEAEIKNVITAVAKTYHYWTEHAQSQL